MTDDDTSGLGIGAPSAGDDPFDHEFPLRLVYRGPSPRLDFTLLVKLGTPERPGARIVTGSVMVDYPPYAIQQIPLEGSGSVSVSRRSRAVSLSVGSKEPGRLDFFTALIRMDHLGNWSGEIVISWKRERIVVPLERID